MILYVSPGTLTPVPPAWLFILGHSGSPHFTVITVPSSIGTVCILLYTILFTLVLTWKFLFEAVGVIITPFVPFGTVKVYSFVSFENVGDKVPTLVSSAFTVLSLFSQEPPKSSP